MSHFDASKNRVQLIVGDFSFLYETRTGQIEVAETSADEPEYWSVGTISVDDITRFVDAIRKINN